MLNLHFFFRKKILMLSEKNEIFIFGAVLVNKTRKSNVSVNQETESEQHEATVNISH